MKRKILAAVLGMIVLCAVILPVAAAPEKPPEFTQQLQSVTFQENSVATYTVKAVGDPNWNLHGTWYMTWRGTTYPISTVSSESPGGQPWEAYAGATYGATSEADHTFTYTFGSIQKELDGATIWCVISDGHFEEDSHKVVISVRSAAAAEKSFQIETDQLPQATVGEPYSAKILGSDPDATFGIANNTAGNNDFDKTGLKLAADGTVSGTPKAVGSYTFTVYATNGDNDDRREFTLMVKEAEPAEPTVQTQPAIESSVDTTEPPSTETQKGTDKVGWTYLLVGAGGIILGIVGTALILGRKKK